MGPFSEVTGAVPTLTIFGAFLVQLATDVGSKFVEDQPHRVISDLSAPYACCIRYSAIGVWEVGIGRDTRGQRTSYDFGKIELRVAGIATGHDDAAHGVAGAIPQVALTRLIETRNSRSFEVPDSGVFLDF